MLALRFFSVVVGDFIAGYCIRSQGVDPHQFSHPVGFFRGARVSAFWSCAALVLRFSQLCSLSFASALTLKGMLALKSLKRALPRCTKDDLYVVHNVLVAYQQRYSHDYILSVLQCTNS